MSDSDFPDGGLQAWLVVLGSALVSFASFGIINCYATFQEFYTSVYITNSTPMAIAFIGALQITLLYVEGIFVGSIFDATGLKFLFPVAAIGSTLSLVALSFTQPDHIYQQFLCQGVLFGFSVGCGFYPALSVIGHYFKKRRALAMGCFAAGSSLGGTFLPIMLNHLFGTIGFRWTVRAAALITLTCYGLAMLMCRTRLPTTKMPSFRSLVDLSGFKDPRYSILVIGAFLVNLGLYIPYYYIEPDAILHGVSENLHPYLLSLINASSLFGRIIGGQLADRFGRLAVLCPSTLISGILILAMWLPAQNTALITAFTILYGLFSGVFISVLPACIAEISPIDRIGARIGTFFAAVSVATLLGTPIGGSFVAVGTKDNYRHLIVFAGVTTTVGSMVMFGGSNGFGLARRPSVVVELESLPAGGLRKRESEVPRAPSPS